MRARDQRHLVLAATAALIGSVLGAHLALAGGGGRPADPGDRPVGPVVVTEAAAHDSSPPLRWLRPTAPGAATQTERPLRSPGEPLRGGPDGATQVGPGSPSVTAIAGTPSFKGIGDGDYGYGVRWAPPDTVGAVGAFQYVQAVNDQLMVFDKTSGTPLLGPIGTNALWSGMADDCAANNDGDPVVVYDKIANRWVISQFSVSTTPYRQCVAVSQTADATGAYHRYSFQYDAFNDYPKMGVWPDGYYVTYNMFGSRFQGTKVCALEREAMLTGAAARQQCVQVGSSYGSLLPADLDGRALPPSGSPNLLLNRTTNALNLWRFSVDWANTGATALTGPVSIPVAAYSAACSGGKCITQPGTSQKLDSLADRLMFRLAYRNFGDHEALVVTHSVTPANALSGIRWYELRNAPGSTMAASTPVVFQQGTYAPDGTARWMGSAAMDAAGDLAVGYSVSSSSVFPGLRYAARSSGDAAGTLGAEVTIVNGSGSQTQTLSRWGDYAAMTIDPVDDCTFWFTGEYLTSSGTWNWHTWIHAFRFPGCSTPTGPLPPSAPASLVSSATDGSVSLAWTAPGSDGGASITGYLVSRNGVALATVDAGTFAYTDTTGTNGTTYTYGVAATNETGTGLSASAVATPGPAAPTLTAATASGKGVQLTWTTPAQGSADPIVGYRISRGTSSGSLATTINVGIVNAYRDSATSRGVTYWYRIAALFRSGATSAVSNLASGVAK